MGEKKPESIEVESQEDREETAIFVLATLRRETLEPNAYYKLQKLKQKFLSERESSDNKDSKKLKPSAPKLNVRLQLPEAGNSFDTTNLPEYPPIQTLWNLGEISPPLRKNLTESDVGVSQARLLLSPPVFVKKHYIPLLNDEEDVKKGISVTVYGPDGKDFEMVFKLWSNKSYVLNHGWTKFCVHYKLRPLIYYASIWMFRSKLTNNLCFATHWTINPSTTEKIHRSKGIRIEERSLDCTKQGTDAFLG